VITHVSTAASKICFLGFLASSDKVVIPSNPMYVSAANAVADAIR